MKTKWPADKVERRPLDTLIPDARNARKHSPMQVAQIAGSMKEWGWTNPVLVDEGGRIIAGHGRVLAAGRLGFTEAPVMVAEGWTEAQKRAYVIADNQLALAAEWDMPMLASEVQGLADWNYDLSLLGFSDLDELLRHGDSGLTDHDDAPPVPDNPISVPGDLWLLGPHRLLCGSSVEDAAVKRVMNGERAHLVATDPPYLVEYAGGDHPGRKREKEWGDLHADHSTKNKDYIEGNELDFFHEFISRGVTIAARVDAPWYIWHADRRIMEVASAMTRSGLLIHQTIIWVKSRPVLTYSHFMQAHEPCLYGWRKGHVPPRHRRAPVNERTVWEISSRIDDGVTGVHPTQKPVEIVARPIRYHTKAGELIYEPFSGSGTALIAAESEGRRCYALELSPAFVDVAVRRWQNFTGERAVLEGTGEPFPAELEAAA